MTQTNLFRREALAHQSEKLTGEALQARPVSFTILTFAALAMATAVFAYGFWGTYTRKEHVAGYLVPDKGIIKIYSQRSGTVLVQRAREAARVTAGDILFIISSERRFGASLSAEATAIDLLKQRRANLRDELDKHRSLESIDRADLHNRIASLGNELHELEKQREIQQQITDNAQRLANRFTQLGADQFASSIQVQQQVDASLAQQAKLREIGRQRMSLQRELGTLQESLSASELKLATQRSSVERDMRELEQEIAEYEARKDLAITAPIDGIVTGILTKPGQQAPAGAPLASILPTGAYLEAQLLIPTRAAGFVRVGQPVSLRYRAFPYQRFGSHRGQVREIDKTVITGSDIALPLAITEPVYRVTVRLPRQDVLAYGDRIPLQAGMLLDADIAVDHRKLVEWVLSPLYSITGKI